VFFAEGHVGYYASAPKGWGHYALMAVVFLSDYPSVSLVPDPQSKTKGRRELKIGRNEAQDTGDPWSI